MAVDAKEEEEEEEAAEREELAEASWVESDRRSEACVGSLQE